MVGACPRLVPLRERPSERCSETEEDGGPQDIAEIDQAECQHCCPHPPPPFVHTSKVNVYRGISLIANRHPPSDHHGALGIVLLQDPKGFQFLMRDHLRKQRELTQIKVNMVDVTFVHGRFWVNCRFSLLMTVPGEVLAPGRSSRRAGFGWLDTNFVLVQAW